MEFEEHIRLQLGDQKLVVRCLGLEDQARVRLEHEAGSLELSRADWRELHRVLARVLAPLPPPPVAIVEPPHGALPVKPARQGSTWDEDEDVVLADGWRAGLPVKALAQRLERTTGAVASRLVRLGLEPSKEAVRLASRGKAAAYRAHQEPLVPESGGSDRGSSASQFECRRVRVATLPQPLPPGFGPPPGVGRPPRWGGHSFEITACVPRPPPGSPG